MARVKYKPFVYYEEAMAGFAEARKILNECKEKGARAFLTEFQKYKEAAKNEDAIAMDVLAYYYKTGAGNFLPENYNRYITWELVAAGRGNTFAIEKLQFLIGYACDQIIDCDDFETIKYKNDIDQYNLLYVLGKAVCKIVVRNFLKAYPVDLVELEDTYSPYEQKDFVTLRRYIDEAIPLTINFLKS